jgi:hypothetical protein
MLPGAATPMGRRDIAELLLEHGARRTCSPRRYWARPKSCARSSWRIPEARNSLGSHGIPLRAHAVAGGEQARPVLELLDTAV